MARSVDAPGDLLFDLLALQNGLVDQPNGTLPPIRVSPRIWLCRVSRRSASEQRTRERQSSVCMLCACGVSWNRHKSW
jgi:hypothetical protein